MEEFAGGVEDLDALVLAVGDVDVAFRVEADGVGQVELALAGPLAAPGEEKLAGPVELHDAGVAVAVGDVDVAVWGEGDVGRLVEVALVLAGHVLFAEGHQHLAVGAELNDGVVGVVGGPDVAGGVDAQAVGGGE